LNHLFQIQTPSNPEDGIDIAADIVEQSFNFSRRMDALAELVDAGCQVSYTLVDVGRVLATTLKLRALM
jgi:hypothetical protein